MAPPCETTHGVRVWAVAQHYRHGGSRHHISSEIAQVRRATAGPPGGRMGRFFAQTSLQARTRNAMFATVDTNRKIGIGRRALMSTMVTVRAGAQQTPSRAKPVAERQVCFMLSSGDICSSRGAQTRAHLVSAPFFNLFSLSLSMISQHDLSA